MPQTTIEVRTYRMGTLWSGLLSLTGPGLKAPLDFFAQASVRDVQSYVRSLFASDVSTREANVATALKVQTTLFQNASDFLDRNRDVLGAANQWARDAMLAIAKSERMISLARKGDVEARRSISSIFDRRKTDAEAKSSVSMLQEAAVLLDTGRATMIVSAPAVSTGHDIGTRADLRKLQMQLSGVKNIKGLLPPTLPQELWDSTGRFDRLSHIPYPRTGGVNLLQNF